MIENTLQWAEEYGADVDHLDLPNGLSDYEVKRDLIIQSLQASDNLLVDIFHNRITYQELCANHGRAEVDNFVKKSHERLRELENGEDDGAVEFVDTVALLGDNAHSPILSIVFRATSQRSH